MSHTTLIEQARWLVAWDETTRSHRYLRDADLAFTDGRIIHVGGRYDGPVDRRIDARKYCLMPGLVNVHSHPLSEPMNKGIGEDGGTPTLGLSGLYDLMGAFGPDTAEGFQACAQAAYCELLRSGVTTLVDLSVPYAGWEEIAERSGLRVVLAPMFRSARWFTTDGKSVDYEWSDDAGQSAMRDALATIDSAMNNRSGRLSGMVVPSQVDTCTPKLLAQAKAAANDRHISFQIHAAQSLVEFAEMSRRHGLTSLQWLDSQDLLDENTIIAHAIFVDSHSWIKWGTRKDIDLLAERGTGVAHCPTVFVRHGMLLEHFALYADKGITLGIGTDTFPHNMLEEIRMAVLLARTATPTLEATPTSLLFDAATIGGARLLKRDDIGCLRAGAKADFVLVDIDHPAMRPCRDPIRSWVHTAADRAVAHVYVDGRQVVKDAQVTTIDERDVLQRLDEFAAISESKVAQKHYSKRPALEVAPLTYPSAKA